MLPHDFIQQKQVGEQRAEMNGSVQIIDQLRTNDGLGQNQINGGKRVAGVAIENRKKRRVFFGWPKTLLPNCRRTNFRQSRQSFNRTLQELANLRTPLAAFLSAAT